mgnify:FL=1
MPVIFPKFNSNDLGSNLDSIGTEQESKEKLSCGYCTSTLDDIRRTGRVGCGKCYDVFDKSLVEVFRRVQSGETHRGRKKAQPAEKPEIRALRDEISSLKNKIRQSVKIEDYESAAAYKSRISDKEKMIDEITGKDNNTLTIEDGGDKV